MSVNEIKTKLEEARASGAAAAKLAGTEGHETLMGRARSVESQATYALEGVEEAAAEETERAEAKKAEEEAEKKK